jgi:hypothetical protein
MKCPSSPVIPSMSLVNSLPAIAVGPSPCDLRMIACLAQHKHIESFMDFADRTTCALNQHCVFSTNCVTLFALPPHSPPAVTSLFCPFPRTAPTVPARVESLTTAISNNHPAPDLFMLHHTTGDLWLLVCRFPCFAGAPPLSTERLPHRHCLAHRGSVARSRPPDRTTNCWFALCCLVDACHRQNNPQPLTLAITHKWLSACWQLTVTTMSVTRPLRRLHDRYVGYLTVTDGEPPWCQTKPGFMKLTKHRREVRCVCRSHEWC